VYISMAEAQRGHIEKTLFFVRCGIYLLSLIDGKGVAIGFYWYDSGTECLSRSTCELDSVRTL